MTVADALILTFPRSSSLDVWERLGRLPREAHLLRGLADHYKKVVLVSRNGGSLDAIRAAAGSPQADQIELVSFGEEDPLVGPRASMADRVLARLRDAKSAVVQTYELGDAGIAESLAGQLRRSGLATALVARGGFLPSRVLSYRYGPHSAQAVEAGLQERGICTSAQLVVGGSGPMLDDICWRFGVNPDRTRLVRNFVPADVEPVATTERDADMIFSWGELAISSRYDVVIDAVRALPADMKSKVRLVLAGDGPARPDLEQQAADAEIQAEFLGEIGYEEFVERSLKCAIYVHAAVHNPEPLGVLEAMANGAAVVVADTPGADELIENGVTGVRVPGTADSMTYAIAGMLPDEDWRSMIGQCAAQRVRSRCSIETVLAGLIAAHRDALAETKAQGSQLMAG
ncbi:MAG: glycosyltransferase family 4 protein [Planctomycetota bacterium]